MRIGRGVSFPRTSGVRGQIWAHPNNGAEVRSDEFWCAGAGATSALLFNTYQSVETRNSRDGNNLVRKLNFLQTGQITNWQFVI